MTCPNCRSVLRLIKNEKLLCFNCNYQIKKSEKKGVIIPKY